MCLGAGTAVITAKLPDGDKTFTMNVIDRIVEDIPREEYPEISASANTEESAQNEPNLEVQQRTLLMARAIARLGIQNGQVQDLPLPAKSGCSYSGF